MIKPNHVFATSMVVLCAVCAHTTHAVQNAPMVMSKYGEIQSVNKYSSNPFWTPNSPYNQRFPQPIYVGGPDLTAGDCNRIVGNLISEYCANRNNCFNTRISDVRPIVMVQLSQLPGHNFATSCGGYIDSVFENYKKSYGNVSTNNIVKPAQQNTTTLEIANPFAQKKSEYEMGVAERAAELENLQRQTTPTATVVASEFPKTVADLSFTDRVANASAGYEPYKDLSAYKTPKFETEDEYYERMKSVLTHNISYIGAGAKGCPPTYMTGRGATVSCTPTINHGTCSAWCTDAALTNCQTSYTISPNDRDDKTFYGKCTCNTGYEMDGYKCVKPGAPEDLVDPVIHGGCKGPNPEHRDPTTCECYPSDFMGSDCGCWGKSIWDNTNKKCVCPITDTSNLSIEEWSYVAGACSCPSTKPKFDTATNQCKEGAPSNAGKTYAILQCRTKKAILNSDLSSVPETQDPAGSLGCSTHTHDDINECFTPCQSKDSYITLPQLNRPTALISSKIKQEINRDFCAGNRYHYDGTGSNNRIRAALLFSQDDINLKYAEKNKYLTFTNLEVDKIKKIIEQNQNDAKCSTSNHWWWMIYVLEQTSPGKWKPIDAITLYHK